jgi:hypothetical protein
MKAIFFLFAALISGCDLLGTLTGGSYTALIEFNTTYTNSDSPVHSVTVEVMDNNLPKATNSVTIDGINLTASGNGYISSDPIEENKTYKVVIDFGDYFVGNYISQIEVKKDPSLSVKVANSFSDLADTPTQNYVPTIDASKTIGFYMVNSGMAEVTGSVQVVGPNNEKGASYQLNKNLAVSSDLLSGKYNDFFIPKQLIANVEFSYSGVLGDSFRKGSIRRVVKFNQVIEIKP